MSLLSDEELWALVPNADNLDAAKALQAAILAKLASAELPEPAMRELNPHLNSGHDPYNGATHLQWFTADQLRQAYAQGYAQGAAAQLAQEPTALMWQHDETGRVGFLEAWGPVDLFKASNPRLRIVGPLYTRREAK